MFTYIAKSLIKSHKLYMPKLPLISNLQYSQQCIRYNSSFMQSYIDNINKLFIKNVNKYPTNKLLNKLEVERTIMLNNLDKLNLRTIRYAIMNNKNFVQGFIENIVYNKNIKLLLNVIQNDKQLLTILLETCKDDTRLIELLCNNIENINKTILKHMLEFPIICNQITKTLIYNPSLFDEIFVDMDFLFFCVENSLCSIKEAFFRFLHEDKTIFNKKNIIELFEKYNSIHSDILEFINKHDIYVRLEILKDTPYYWYSPKTSHIAFEEWREFGLNNIKEINAIDPYFFGRLVCIGDDEFIYEFINEFANEGLRFRSVNDYIFKKLYARSNKEYKLKLEYLVIY
jgi:hypothetical protein